LCAEQLANEVKQADHREVVLIQPADSEMGAELTYRIVAPETSAKAPDRAQKSKPFHTHPQAHFWPQVQYGTS
jgi:hypothetical protein